MSWRRIGQDPNDPKIREARQSALTAAMLPAPIDRFAFVLPRVRGRRVLDVGCLDHDPTARDRSKWLHGRLVEVASECVGVDIDPAGVRALRDRGLDVHCHDLTTGPGPLADLEKFDVVVLGEVIEHLTDPVALLAATAALLSGEGEIILTTPNPYAPHRVYAGRTHYAWENADHLYYAYPTGMIELAWRAGLRMTGYTTTHWANRNALLVKSLRMWWAKLWGRRVGPAQRPDSHFYVPPLEVLALWPLWRHHMMGETAIYVLRRADMQPGKLPEPSPPE